MQCAPLTEIWTAEYGMRPLIDLEGQQVTTFGWNGMTWVRQIAEITPGPIDIMAWIRTGHYTDLVLSPETGLLNQFDEWLYLSRIPATAFKYGAVGELRLVSPLGLPHIGYRTMSDMDLKMLATSSFVPDRFYAYRTYIPWIVTQLPLSQIAVFLRYFLRQLYGYRRYNNTSTSIKFPGCTTQDKYRLQYLLSLFGIPVNGPQPLLKRSLHTLDISSIEIDDQEGVARLLAMITPRTLPDMPDRALFSLRETQAAGPMRTSCIQTVTGTQLIHGFLCKTTAF